MFGEPSIHSLRANIQRKKKRIKNRLKSKILTEVERKCLHAQLEILKEL